MEEKKTNVVHTVAKAAATSIVAICVLLGGCSRYYYQPNSVNAPMLSEQHDANIVVNGSWGDDDVNGSVAKSHVINVQGAYSPLPYFGIIGGYTGFGYNIQNDPDPQTGRVDASAHLLEIGVGGYYPVYRMGTSMSLIADAYAGFGGGNLNSDVNMGVNRLFVQPGFSLRTPYGDVGVHARLSGLKFGSFDANGRSEEYINEQNLAGITDGRTYFVEPAVTIRGGYKFIKIQLQHVWSAPTKTIPWNHNDNLTTIGLFFSIDDLMRHKSNK